MNDSDPTLGEIGRKLDSIHADIRRALDDHEQRLRKVERWVYAVPPTLFISAASIIAAVIKA